MPMPYTRPKTTTLTLSRTVPGPASEVFDAWLDPNSPGSPWFGCERVLLSAVVDGLFFHSVTHEGQVWAHYGRFIALDRPRPGSAGRIVHSWVSEGTRGLESRLTLTLEAKGERSTLVTLVHADVPDDEFGRQHQDGWGFVLGALEQRFAGRA